MPDPGFNESESRTLPERYRTVLFNLTLCLGVEFHAVLEQERRVGLRRPVLGGLHVRGDAVRPRQEP